MTYPGGKNGNGVIHTIGRNVPPHLVRVELFGGSFPTFHHIRLAHFNIGLDVDPDPIARAGAEGLDVELVRADALQWVRGVFQQQLSFMGEPETWFRLKDIHTRTDQVLVYADPPYLSSVRSRPGRRYYQAELMEDREHAELLALLESLPCLVMLSGYRSELYDRTLGAPKWRRVDYPAMTRGGLRTESLWMNYPEPTVLHDVTFAGKNFRERWALTKLKRRWVKKFSAMPALKRQAVSEALSAVRGVAGQPPGHSADSGAHRGMVDHRAGVGAGAG